MFNLLLCRNSSFRRPHFLILTLLAIFTCYCLFTGDVDQSHLFSLPVITKTYSLFDFPTSLQHAPLVKGEQSCKFPTLDVHDPSVLQIMAKEKMEPLNCTVKYPLLFDSFVEPHPRLVPVADPTTMEFAKNCCYRTINFSGVAQNHEFSSKCWPVSQKRETTIPREHEFISIECEILNRTSDDVMHWENKIVDMHAFPHLVKKQNVQKLNKGLNVVIVGLDSLSRMNFHRTMPETYNYIVNKLKAVEMEGMNKIGDNTFPNIGPFLTNQFVSDDSSKSCAVNKSDKACNFIWQQFASKGYQTLYFEDETSMAILNHLYLNNSTTHYYFPSFLNVLDKHLGHERRIAANMCFGPWMAAQKTLDYVKKMAVVMKKSNLNYFQFGWLTSITHDYINGGRLMDNEITKMLKWYHYGGFLKNTILLLMSDHGMRIGEIRGNYQGQLEERLPFVYIVLPQAFKRKYTNAYGNLRNNGKRLITVWDLHQTLRHILEPENLQNRRLSQFRSTSEKGMSLFQPIPISRTCEEAGVPLLYCACNIRMDPLPLNDSLVIHVAGQVIKELNSVLKSEPLCAQLSLGKILKASKISFINDHTSTSSSFSVLASWQAYKVTFKTVPTWTTFDAIVTQDGGDNIWTPKNIGRYTWYWLDNKAACLGKWREEISLVMYYCYCKEYT